ncbi:UNVERIFIED_ORG: ribosomal protein L16 Arg81 hydroxylase [Agrobacterium larrymoorei]|nr:ribosomal protein L16 Arg81 hydroxylase [Agrobacterium larrymoorei]
MSDLLGDAIMSNPEDLKTSEIWRKQPALLRGVFQIGDLRNFDRAKYALFVSQLPHMRVFVAGQSDSGGAPVARLVPRESAPDVFAHLTRSALEYTVLLNQVEKIDLDVRRIRKAMKVPHRWREDDIVVTYSTPGSGIGYHAGHEDAIIVQAAGRRRWRVWAADAVDPLSRRRILLSALGDVYSLQKSCDEPLIDCELGPGDALYIPPFCPHEGTTVDESISIALGWRGVAYFHLIDACKDLISPPANAQSEELPQPFFELIHDFEEKAGSTLDLANSVVSRLVEIGCSVSNPLALSARLEILFRSQAAE